jgi:predicted transcriptional regulator YdeE
VERERYGVDFGPGEPPPVDLIAASSCLPTTVAPEGLFLRAIDGGRYAVFTRRMSETTATWREVYENWTKLLGSGPAMFRGLAGLEDLLKTRVPIFG